MKERCGKTLGCDCPILKTGKPGTCPVHRSKMYRHAADLCFRRPDYFDVFAARGFGQKRPRGLGDTLAWILKALHLCRRRPRRFPWQCWLNRRVPYRKKAAPA